MSIFQALEEEKRKIASDMEVDLRKVMKSSLQEQNKLFACLVGQRLDIGNPKAYYTALQSVLENDFLGMKSTISSREHVNQVSSTPNAYHLAGLRSLLSSAVVPMPDFLLTVLNSQEDFHVGSSPGRMDVMGGFSDYSGSSALQYPTAERVLVLAAKCQRDGNDKSPASINMASIQIPSLHHMSSLEIGSNAVVVQEAKLATSHLFSSGRYKTADELQKLLREQFPVKEMRDRWSHYLVGMLHSLAQHNPEISEEDSFTLVSISDLPWNAGLASSAAVEVASAMAIGNLLRLSRDILNPLAVAQICQKVENGVVGGQCGIMDQLAVTHVESGINPMLVGMRCRLPFPTTATYSVPLPNGLSAVAIDSNVKRSTVSGQYQRVRDAATIGKQVLERCLDQSINYLCDIPPSQLDRHKGKLPFSVSVEEANKILSRNSYPKGEDSREEVHYPVLAATTFPIEENYRVLHFESILRAMNLRAVENPNLLLLGELMSQSHNGYVSCGLNHTFTDTLVQLLESQAGVVGAKSSGGGGGGAVVALVKDEFFQRENSFAEVQDKYYAATGATCNLRHGSSGGAKYHGILSRYFSTDSKKGRSNLKPRVLVANHGYPPDFNGGSEVYAQALALTLKRSGNCESVHVFAREHNPYRPDFELRRTVDQLDEYLPVYLMNYSREAPYFRSIAEEVDKAFAEVLEEVKPDVLHLHHMNHLSLGLPAVAKAAGVPVVYTLHDYWLMCPRGQFLQTGAAHNDPWQQCDGQEDSKCAKHCYASRYALGSYESATDVDNEQQYWTSWIGTRMAAVKEACNNIDVFIAPSHYLFDKFIGQFTLPPSKVLLEPYGFDRDRLVGRSRSLETSRNTILTDDKPFVFAYIGRHQPAKGINLLVEASLELLMGYPEATKLPFVLKIFGRQDSNSTRALLRMIDSCPHPLTKGILQFEAEYVNKDIIQKVFNEVDCIVVPSIWEENSPLVIHEALQCKVPVITSSAGGMGELIKNAVNGLTFEHRSSNSLSQTMRKAVEQPDGIRFLAERGYLYSNDGQIPCLNVHVNKLLTLYRNLTTGEDITATLAADSWYLKNVYNYDKSTAIDETYPTIESPTNSSSAPKLEVPWRITFDTNPDDCNFSCTMCEQHSEFSPHQKARKDQGIRRRRMDIELISKTIAELAPRGLKEVIPTTMGEPLMYKEFPRMIELCKEHGVKLNLTTNGSFYGGSVEAWAEKIVPVGSDVKISWNGITHETQQKIMKRSNLYTHINNLRRMIKVRDRVAAEGGNYCSVTLQLTFMEDNLPELPRLVEFAIEEGCDRVKGHHLWAHFDQIKNQNMRRSPESIRRWNDTAQQCRMIAASKSRKDGTHLRLDNFFDLSESTGMNEIDPTAVCPFLGQEAWVNAKGRFDPCCAPDLERKSLGSFGDINEDRSLMDVWNSDSYNDLVKNYKKKPLCKNCNMRRPIV